jgi:glycosyltransferase involved in cell wall biosynthesis
LQSERLLFIVPAYNEASNVGPVVRELKAHHPDGTVVVVNDGSTDATAAAASEAGAIVIDLPFNLGIGGAVQTGMLYAERNGFDFAVQFDGDGQHVATEVTTLLAPLRDGSADAVIGSRFLGGRSFRPPLARRLGIALFNGINRIVTGRRFTDNTSGFRAYNRSAIAFLAHDYPHDYPEPESVVTLCRAGFRVIEVPAAMRERQAGSSSITYIRSIYYMFKVLLAIIVGFTRSGRRTR